MAQEIEEEKPVEIKRLALNLPVPLYEKIEEYATKEQVTVTEAIRRFLRIGLYTEDVYIYVKDDHTEEYRELVFI